MFICCWRTLNTGQIQLPQVSLEWNLYIKKELYVLADSLYSNVQLSDYRAIERDEREQRSNLI